MENPLERIQKAKSEEAQQSEQSFEAKLEKVNSELLKLPEYKSRLDFLKQEKQKVSEALETKDDPQIEAEKGNLEKYLTDLENELNPLQSRVHTLDGIEYDKNIELAGKSFMELVDVVAEKLNGSVPEATLVAKNQFNGWTQVADERIAKGGIYKEDHDSIFPRKFYTSPSIEWNKYNEDAKEITAKYGGYLGSTGLENIFQTPKDIPDKQAYPWKEAMKISKRYWQESSEGGAEAFKRDVLHAKL